MLNLIDQQDILKGLDDTALQREMAQPSGGAPPFLVLSEISRRKDMRQRYAGELAAKAPPTTVAQDVMSAPAMPGMGPMPMGGGGIAAAAQMGGGMPSPMPTPPGYASGGIVSAADPSVLDYSSLAQKYQSDLDSLPQDRNQAQALALLAAGAGILGGGHSNLGQNLGVGIGAGINSYQDALKTTDARETNALRGLSDLATNQHSDALQRLQLAADPTDVKTFKFRQGLPPDQQATFDDTINPNAAFKRDQLTQQADNVAQIGDAKVNGTQPPGMTGLYHMAPLVQAYIAKTYPDFNLANAQQDYDATKRYLSTMNGPAQIRLKQAVDFTDSSIDKLAGLADQWNGGQFPLLNKANLVAAKQGLKGPEAQAIATELDSQIGEVVSELATVYKGGNSPTDEGLKLAATQFQSDWSKDTFNKLVKQIRDNLKYRKNSLNQLVVSASGDGNMYQPTPTGTAGSAAPPPSAAAPAPTADVPWKVVSP